MKKMLEKPLPVDKTTPATVAGPAYPPTERRAATFYPKARQRLLDGDNAEIRNSVRQLIMRLTHCFIGQPPKVFGGRLPEASNNGGWPFKKLIPSARLNTNS